MSSKMPYKSRRVTRHIKKHWPKKAKRRYLLAITPVPWNPMMLVNKGDSFIYCDMSSRWISLIESSVKNDES